MNDSDLMLAVFVSLCVIVPGIVSTIRYRRISILNPTGLWISFIGCVLILCGIAARANAFGLSPKLSLFGLVITTYMAIMLRQVVRHQMYLWMKMWATEQISDVTTRMRGEGD